MARSLEGLLLLNALCLIAGLGLFWAVRGWNTWTEFCAFAGVAYIMGLSAVGVTATLVVIFGAGLSTPVIVTLVILFAVPSAAFGIVRGRPLPGRLQMPRPSTWPLAAVVPAVALVGVLAEFFRAARTSPLNGYDDWAFWLPKAKAIYFFGGLDEHLFRTLAGPSYPILVPTLDAMSFRFMGSADTITLAVEYFFLLAGFTLAAAGLVWRLASPALVWLFLLLVVLIPQVQARLFDRTADWPLDFFFVLAALALARRLLTREAWPLIPYGLFLAAMLATKREGQLLAACLVVAGIAAAGWRRRRDWIYIVFGAGAAYLVNIPWRIWWTSRHLTSDVPATGVIGGTLHFARIGASVRLVLGWLFDPSAFLPIVFVALVAAAIAWTRPQRTLVIFFGLLFLLGVVGFAWVNWSDPTLPISRDAALNPTERAVSSLALLAAAMSPLLLEHALRGSRTEP